jgi:hypothetical protein
MFKNQWQLLCVHVDCQLPGLISSDVKTSDRRLDGDRSEIRISGVSGYVHHGTPCEDGMGRLGRRLVKSVVVDL